MSEWELRVSQRELHRLHVVRLTLEGRESVAKGAKFRDLGSGVIFSLTNLGDTLADLQHETHRLLAHDINFRCG